MANKALWIGCGSFCCALIITGIVLFAISFRSLEATEFGIRYNAFSKQVDETKIYEEGTHFLGPAVRFIKFPLEVKAINFGGNPFSIRTSDGMKLDIIVTLQYKLNKQLSVTLQLLRRYGEDNYEPVIQKVAQDTIRVTASGFSIDQYVYNRQDIAVSMNANLTRELGNLGVNLENFQLTGVKFPDEFNTVILDTQRLQIDQTNAANNRVFRTQQASNQLLRANIDAANFLQNRRSQIVARMALYNQLASVYSSYVNSYVQQLVTREALYDSALWANEYADLVNSKLAANEWQTKDVVPTPTVFRNMFNK